ncbi:MAG TPA: hypothetical protein VMQ52_04785 [Candidatus Saccharimonadales bacterium]|nr:hypothetical protein [Candidatus Saccharimonadales bacterium]
MRLANVDVELPASLEGLVDKWREETLSAASYILRNIKARIFGEHSQERYGSGLTKRQYRELGAKCQVLGISESDISALVNSELQSEKAPCFSSYPGQDVTPAEVTSGRQHELSLIQSMVANYVFAPLTPEEQP